MTRAMRARKPAPQVELLVQSSLWNAEVAVEEYLRAAIAAAAAQVAETLPENAELAVVLTDDAAIRMLNRDWRGTDRSTNVLSFPAGPSGAQGGSVPLGDIVIAYETTVREAAAEEKPFKNHVSHLAIHGFLHLLGYDHAGEKQAEQMERLERAILSTLGIPDPFRS